LFHGKTRNLGARIGKGEYLVFLSQDAIPASDTWLQKLTSNMDDPNVAAAYGRQISNEDVCPVENFFMAQMYPPVSKKIRESVEKRGGLSIDDIFFSNVNYVMKNFKKYYF